MKNTLTREEWLNKAVVQLTPWFEAHGYKVPTNLRVSVGWPKGSREVIGQCFPTAMSSDEHFEIFISPTLDEPTRVLDVLIHELIHAVLPPEVKHGKEFKKAMKDLELEGKATATVASPILVEKLAKLVEKLGDYPHKALRDPSKSKGKGKPKQKAWTWYKSPENDEFRIQLGPKILEQGIPLCPFTKEPMVPEGENDEGDED